MQAPCLECMRITLSPKTPFLRFRQYLLVIHMMPRPVLIFTLLKENVTSKLLCTEHFRWEVFRGGYPDNIIHVLNKDGVGWVRRAVLKLNHDAPSWKQSGLWTNRYHLLNEIWRECSRCGWEFQTGVYLYSRHQSLLALIRTRYKGCGLCVQGISFPNKHHQRAAAKLVSLWAEMCLVRAKGSHWAVRTGDTRLYHSQSGVKLANENPHLRQLEATCRPWVIVY